MNRTILGLLIILVIILLIINHFYIGQNRISQNTPGLGGQDTTTSTTPPINTQTSTGTQQTEQPGKNNGTQTTAPEERRIVIGLTVSLTGRYYDAGVEYLCGVLSAVEYINSNGGIMIGGERYNLTLVYYDDASGTERIPSLYAKLVEEDDADFLLGPYSTLLSLVAAPLAEQYGIPMVIAGSISDKLFDQGFENTVQIMTPASRYFEGVMELVSMYVPDPKIAIIYENSVLYDDIAEGARAKAESLGLPIVYDAAFERGTTSFESYVESGKSSGANVLIVVGHFQSSLEIVRLAHDMGWRLKFVSATIASAYPEFLEAVGEQVALGVSSVTQWLPGSYYTPERTPTGYEWYGPTYLEWLGYFNKVKNRGGVCWGIDEPTFRSAAGAAGVLFLAKAVEEAQTLDPSAVRQAMNNLSICTFFGKLRIDPETGKQIGHEMIVTQWQEVDGQLRNVVVFPGYIAESAPLIAPANWWG